MTLRAGLRRWFLRPPLPHGEEIEDRRVSFPELFYDLVYVVLIGQLAHTLAEDISWSGMLEFRRRLRADLDRLVQRHRVSRTHAGRESHRFGPLPALEHFLHKGEYLWRRRADEMAAGD